MDDLTNDCPKCEFGMLKVYATRVDKSSQTRTQYLRCDRCGHREDPRIIPLSSSPVQSRRGIVMRRVKQNRLF